MKVEAEGKELVLRSNSGDVAIIPVDRAKEAQDLIKSNDQAGINAMIASLPTEQSMAAEGTLIENVPEPQVMYDTKEYNKAVSDMVGKQESYNKDYLKYQGDMDTYRTDSIQFVNDSDTYNSKLDLYSNSKRKFDAIEDADYANRKAAYDDAVAGMPDGMPGGKAAEEGVTPEEVTRYNYEDFGNKEASPTFATVLEKTPTADDIYEYDDKYVSELPDGMEVQYDKDFASSVIDGTAVEPIRTVVDMDGNAIPMYDEPEVPVAPYEPIKPVKDFTTDITYDNTYENMVMSPAWADNIKNNPNANIGTLDPLDTAFKKGFTMEEAKAFPDSVKKQFGIDYIQGKNDGSIVEDPITTKVPDKKVKPVKANVEGVLDKATKLNLNVDDLEGFDNDAQSAAKAVGLVNAAWNTYDSETQKSVVDSMAGSMKRKSPKDVHGLLMSTTDGKRNTSGVIDSVIGAYNEGNDFSRINKEVDNDVTSYSVEGKVAGYELATDAKRNDIYNRVWDIRRDDGSVVTDSVDKATFDAGVAKKKELGDDYYETIIPESNVNSVYQDWSQKDAPDKY